MSTFEICCLIVMTIGASMLIGSGAYVMARSIGRLRHTSGPSKYWRRIDKAVASGERRSKHSKIICPAFRPPGAYTR